MPMFVLRGCALSAAKLNVPLKLDVRWAGRVVCSMKNPTLKVCEPLAFVMFVEKFSRVLYP
jgi:hypothetical protein